MANQLGQLTTFSSGQKLFFGGEVSPLFLNNILPQITFYGGKKSSLKKEFTKNCHNCLKYERVLNYFHILTIVKFDYNMKGCLTTFTF
jgi:hypothetical protein